MNASARCGSMVAVLALLCACGGDRLRSHKQEPPPPPPCGNGVIDDGEDCDGSNLAGQSCTGLGFDLGTLSCDSTCHFITSGCTKRCGNGTLDVGEACDGALGDLSCDGWGYATCSSTCSKDLLHCRQQSFSAMTPLGLTRGGRTIVTDLSPTGIADLVIADPDLFRVVTQAWTQTRGFEADRNLDNPDQKSPVWPIAADVDGDGATDLVTVDQDGSVYRLRYLASSRTFDPLALQTASCQASVPFAALDTDGVAGDEVFALGCPTSTSPVQYDALLIFPGGGVVPPTTRKLDVTGTLAAALAKPSSGPAQLFLANASSQLEIRTGPAFDPATPLALPAVATALAVADFDGDGDLDVVMAGGGTVRVLENLGDALVERKSWTADGQELLARDLDLDGRPDIAWVEAGAVQLRRAAGAFVFVDSSTPIGSGTPISLAVGDVDQDGDPDLVVARRSGSTALSIDVLLNQVR